MGFDGPVWHVSVCDQTGGGDPLMQEDVAYYTLEGYGDEALGQWTEVSGRFVHLRRRLSEAEAALVGPVVDVRGTPEAARRAYRVARWVMLAGDQAREVAAREVEGR